MSEQQPDYQTSELPENPRDPNALRRIMSYQLVANELTARRKLLISRLDLAPGEKVNIETEWGESLGSASKGKVSYKAVPADESVLLGSADEADMEWQITGDTDDLIDFLLGVEGGTNFLTTRLSERAVERMSGEALNKWRKTGDTPVGWRISESTPSTRATASKLAKDMVADFLEGNEAQLALSPAPITDFEEN